MIKKGVKMQKEVQNQDYLRGDGKIPIISVVADNLAEATFKSIIECYDKGARVETPKHKEGGSLGYDADITIRINFPDSEPKICYPGMHDGGEGVMQYILEVTHGIHNHWKKSKEHPDRWGYTYNERFIDQLPFVFQRIKHDWDKRKRITGRDYQFSIWRAGEDIILDQEDPPCFQRGHLRFLKNDEGDYVFNYITDWRSRDHLKAWNENNIGQIELMKLMRDKVSDMLQIPIKIGAYIDRSSSLHLYGYYIDRDGLDKKINRMKQSSYDIMSCSLEDYFINTTSKNGKQLKGLVAAQMDAESKGHGLNQPEARLKSLGYDVDNFPYPSDWDSWPKGWDAEPDIDKLACVWSDEEILKRTANILDMSYEYFEEKVLPMKRRTIGDGDHSSFMSQEED